MTKFYTFRQNNSGGTFDIDEQVAQIVIVEAKDYKHANALAEDIGIYFDGCEKGFDCDCCGDRWSSQWDDNDGYSVPSIYGKPIGEYVNKFWDEEYRIYYLNGLVVSGVIKKEEVKKEYQDFPSYYFPN